MPATKHTCLLILGTGLIYFWMRTDLAASFGLQALAALMLVFLLIRYFVRTDHSHRWHILPQAVSLEMVILHMAMLLVVASTGATQSPLFALTYIQLFLLVLTGTPLSAGLTTVSIMFFYYLPNQALAYRELVTLLTLPAVWLVTQLVKQQYDQLRLEQQMRTVEERQLELISQSEQTLESFLTQFVRPKLILFESELSGAGPKNETLRSQFSLLQSELDKLVTKIHDLSRGDTRRETD